jgi:predicted nucleotidyltransferase
MSWRCGDSTCSEEANAMTTSDLLQEIKSRLAKAYGPHFRGVVLYGSVARGDDRPDSDIDVMVLLDHPAETWEDVHAACAALMSLMLEIDKIIHVMAVDVHRYEGSDAPLYAEARREGVRA